MNTLNSARSTAINPSILPKPRLNQPRGWWAGFSIATLALLILFIRQSDPLSALEAAKAQWAASGITDYRIVVTFERPYTTCQQDFDVRGTDINYKHKDTCSVGAAVIVRPAAVYPTVENLFARIEDSLTTPQCGPNGCICDGPIEVTASYDADHGYPLEIVYTLRQDLRTRDLQYWLALLDGTLATCPQVTYIGQTIRVTSLEPLDPLAEQLSAEATKEPLLEDGANGKPKTLPH